MSAKEARKIKKAVAKNVAHIREALNLSQNSLALIIGVHETYVAVIESGRLDVTFYMGCKLADALDVNLMVLAGRQPMPPWVKAA